MILIAWLISLDSRLDRAKYALACDDEACKHYKEKPCSLYRARLATKAFLLNE
jgi:hypothetical protein